MVEAYCLKDISEPKAKRNKRLKKHWSSLKFMIENRNTKPVSRTKKKIIYTFIHTYIYIYIQGDNSLLTKRSEKVLKSEQIVCSQRL